MDTEDNFYHDLCQDADELGGDGRHAIYCELLSNSPLLKILTRTELRYLAYDNEPSAPPSITANADRPSLVSYQSRGCIEE